MKEGICTAVGVVGSAIAAAFGGWDQALVTLVIFMVIDYLSGLIVAGIFHNSRKTENGALESRAAGGADFERSRSDRGRRYQEQYQASESF